MLKYLKLVWIFLALVHYKVDGAISRVYSAGGSNSNINSNGFNISQLGNILYCGSLSCIGAVNCEITRYDSNVHEKCTDIHLHVIDQMSYITPGFSDVELYFGPAYQKQAEEQAKKITDQINSELNNAFSGFANNNGIFQNSATFFDNNNGTFNNSATYKKAMTYLSIFTTFLLISLLR